MRFLFRAVFFSVYAVPSFAADIFNGDELHSQSCTGCHDSAVYIRENRIAQTLPRLGTQVRFCKNNLGIAWFDDEVEDVIGFLNKNYYHF
jgi:hypothetical protein